MDSFLSKNIDSGDRLNSRPNCIAGPDPWIDIQKFTSARIAIGRTGGSQRTPSILDFRLAHARARDAVYSVFKPTELAKTLAENGVDSQILATNLTDRAEYLMQPDLGKRLDDASRALLVDKSEEWGRRDFAIVVSDGLSANAANLHAAETIMNLLKFLPKEKWSMYPVLIVPFARVKVQDDIGEILGLRHSLILIGERPGLGSPDSLSAYFTFKPVWASVESDRNCISNIRPMGMPPAIAAKKIAMLLMESERLKISGTALKDNIDIASLESGTDIVI